MHDPGNRIQAEPIHSLTGMRFIAALVVFFSHVRESLYVGIAAVAWGGPAVSYFFVLSGFILTWVYDSRLQQIGVRTFYLRRIARLWPLHLTCLFLCLWLTAPLVWGDSAAASSPASLLAQVFLVQAWIPFNNWQYGFNSVSWSISTEMFFYLVFPLWLALPRRWLPLGFLAALAVALAVLALFARFLATGPPDSQWNWAAAAIVNPLVRLPEFVLGMLACRWTFRPANPTSPGRPVRSAWRDTMLECLVVGLTLAAIVLLIASGIIERVYRLPGGAVWGNWLRVASGMGFFALVIAVFSVTRGGLSHLLGSRLMIWLGEISYAFYLVHQIVIRYLDDRLLAGWQLIVSALLISVLVSGLLFRVIEMPCKSAAALILAGKWRKAGKPLAAGWKFPLTRQGLFHSAALVLVVWVTLSIRPPLAGEKQVADIIAATPPAVRNIEFRGEGVLLGFESIRQPGGRMLRLAWNLKPGFSRGRFVHISDLEKRIISQVPVRDFRAAGIPAGQPFVEEIWISNERIYRGYRIGIGFWSAARGTAPMVSPPQSAITGLGGNRLEVDTIKPRQWK